MAYDEGVAQRVRAILGTRTDVTEKKMFGGLAFMVRGHMCCGIKDDTLMARVGNEWYEEALEKPHVREMDFTGKPLKGFVYIDPKGLRSDRDLKFWVGLCEAFALSLPPK